MMVLRAVVPQAVLLLNLPHTSPARLGPPCPRTSGIMRATRGGAKSAPSARARSTTSRADESKQSAGKNTSPNVLTPTFVTCLVYLNMYTLLDYKKWIERSKRGSSLALPLFTFNELVATKAGAMASRDQ